MNYTKFLLTCLLLILSCNFVLAQDTTKTDDFNFDDIPVDDQKTPYIGVGGGMITHVNMINTTELDVVATNLGLPKFDSKNLIMFGGGGFTAIGIIPNLRLGVYAAGGSLSTQSELTLGSETYLRDLTLHTGYTAAGIDYAIGLTKSFNIFPGLLIGISNDKLTLSQTKKAGSVFNQVMDSSVFSGNANFNRVSQLTTSRFMINPQLNFEYNVAQFVMLRAGAGYKLTFDSDWLDANKTVVSGLSKDINTNGLTIQVGLFIGLFQ